MNTTTTEASDAPLAVNIPPGARRPKTRLITRSQIHPDPEQPREFADDELRASIASQGLLEPITVRPHPTILTEWMIVNGERRWRGAEGVLEDLTCIVRTDLDDPIARLAVQLVANTGKPMTPLEEARAFRRMVEASGMSVADLAELLGRAPSTVSERLALLELGPWLALIEAGELPMSHAVKVLLPLRAVPDNFHEKAIKGIQGDYRWTHKGAGRGISLGDFERLVNRYYRAAMYPLVKTKGYGKQPEFNTSKHDAECGCGSIKFDLTGSGTTRVCCCNPGWWGPLHRAAKKSKKPAGGKSSASKGKTLYLPAAAKTVKSSYGSAPSGVIQLTDSNGDWDLGRHNGEATFDPADLIINEAKLVQWTGYGNGYPYVGTTDAAAVKAARDKWVARWNAEYSTLVERFGKDLYEQRSGYIVEGAGSAVLTTLLGTDAIGAAIDVARALTWEIPASVLKAGYDRSERAARWLESLSVKEASVLLSCLATLAGLKMTLPSLKVAQLQAKALEGIRKRTIPWKAKPKAEEKKPTAKKKSASKKAPAKASSRGNPDGAFMKPQYPSAALAAVVGSQPQPRTEVTKKLWSYIKKHKLQDVKERRNINADAKLLPVFGGRSQITLFEMTKMVNKHLAGTAEAAALIFTSKKKQTNVPLAKPSDETAELPLAGARSEPPATCIVCGCTDDHACEGGCTWLVVTRGVKKPHGVCSECATDPEHAKAIEHAATLAEIHGEETSVGKNARMLLAGARHARKQADLADDEEEEDSGWVTHKDGSDDLWDAPLGSQDLDEDEDESPLVVGRAKP